MNIVKKYFCGNFRIICVAAYRYFFFLLYYVNFSDEFIYTILIKINFQDKLSGKFTKNRFKKLLSKNLINCKYRKI